MFTARIAGYVYETDDASLLECARLCGPGFARRIAAKEGKVWRVVS